MSKYKRKLVQDIEEQQLFVKEQKELKRKHHIPDQEERIIVEKSNMVKFLIRTGGAILRSAASICICILAVIGLAAVVYPAPRAELLIVWESVVTQLLQFIPL